MIPTDSSTKPRLRNKCANEAQRSAESSGQPNPERNAYSLVKLRFGQKTRRMSIIVFDVKTDLMIALARIAMDVTLGNRILHGHGAERIGTETPLSQALPD